MYHYFWQILVFLVGNYVKTDRCVTYIPDALIMLQKYMCVTKTSPLRRSKNYVLCRSRLVVSLCKYYQNRITIFCLVTEEIQKHSPRNQYIHREIQQISPENQNRIHQKIQKLSPKNPKNTENQYTIDALA